MYSQIQEAEEEFSILHCSADTLYDLAKWNSISEPKTLYLESGKNNSLVAVKK